MYGFLLRRGGGGQKIRKNALRIMWTFPYKVKLRSRNLLKKWDLWPHHNVFCWDKYYFSESLVCTLTENYNEFKSSSLFFQGIVKQSKIVRQPTCLETNFILILNFPRISAKYAPKYQKRIIFYEFKQFWWIWNFMPMSTLIIKKKHDQW